MPEERVIGGSLAKSPNWTAGVPIFARRGITRGAFIGCIALMALTIRPPLGFADQLLLLAASTVLAARLGGLFPGLAATTAACAVVLLFPDRLLSPEVTRPELTSVVLLGSLGALFSLDAERRIRAGQHQRDAFHTLRERVAELDRFNCVLCHDLKSPLRTVASFCELLERQTANQLNSSAVQSMHFIKSAVDRMSRLIDGLLSYSKPSYAEAAVNDPNLILRDVLKALQFQIESTGAVVSVDQLPLIRMDEQAMYQVFQNLIENALKYRSDKPPQIRISCIRRTDDVCVVVSDNGIGLDMRYAETIFEPFQRLHAQPGLEGVGLGLATCKRTALRHGGRIWVESEPGAGSSFVISLPYERIVIDPQAMARRRHLSQAWVGHAH